MSWFELFANLWHGRRSQYQRSVDQKGIIELLEQAQGVAITYQSGQEAHQLLSVEEVGKKLPLGSGYHMKGVHRSYQGTRAGIQETQHYLDITIIPSCNDSQLPLQGKKVSLSYLIDSY